MRVRTASLAAGLTDAEVAQRVADGKVNDVPVRATRSVADLVRANVFTRINAILGVLFAIVLATGSLINGLFGLLIVANSVIGMVQELRAKQTLDRLAIVGQARSELRTGINKILQLITYLLIPAGLLIIYAQLFTTHVSWWQSVLHMVGALVPMVPEGLVLMTSIAFAVGVVRLGRRRCLVQELPAIEGLARVDVVCADKTGTLTENRMQVADLQRLDSAPGMDTIVDVLASMAAHDAHPNASMKAIAEAYRNPPAWAVTATAPFKSATKWSGVSYREHGNWVLGAPDVLLAPSSAVAAQAEHAGSHGLRVSLLGFTGLPVDHPHAPDHVVAAALIMLEQRVRPDARETLDYFAAQNVSVKVISGDNAVSVGAVTSALGLSGKVLDARKLPTDPDELAGTLERYTAFGRVRPDQKRAMVRALQSRGNTVAMTGDGVNDMLALKDADIGVAIAAGSSASRAVAQIVLLTGPPDPRHRRNRYRTINNSRLATTESKSIETTGM